jgi:hypothetical protein
MRKAARKQVMPVDDRADSRPGVSAANSLGVEVDAAARSPVSPLSSRLEATPRSVSVGLARKDRILATADKLPSIFGLT